MEKKGKDAGGREGRAGDRRPPKSTAGLSGCAYPPDGLKVRRKRRRSSAEVEEGTVPPFVLHHVRGASEAAVVGDVAQIRDGRDGGDEVRETRQRSRSEGGRGRRRRGGRRQGKEGASPHRFLPPEAASEARAEAAPARRGSGVLLALESRRGAARGRREGRCELLRSAARRTTAAPEQADRAPLLRGGVAVVSSGGASAGRHRGVSIVTGSHHDCSLFWIEVVVRCNEMRCDAAF
eukprot:CAMPEP_0197189480 /NCGR_PEP_ID=MMETSP1423-20130617/19803_1 /TAXON_ID=476441 /ORGANISM="Pseudo-nitzschia heimii, Strain UNC1101" /LENGTH=235 /DNA_ID=CAMNT_0042641595 /DNA_START=155 /DNA_END=862 /DNA_ORIENTATION=+